MEDVLLATWKPEWDVPIWRVETRIRAMGADSLASARRIHQPIEAPGDVVNAFDAITYSKGSAILSMFESYLGPEVLRRGVRRYLTKHAFGTATAEDFVAAISAEAGRDLAPVLSSFLDQPGVPLVTAELSCEQGRVPRLKLSQRRYLPLGSKGDRNKRWQIPLCARYGSPKSAGRACTLLTEAEGSLELPGPACPTWVMPNAGAAGYYRLAPRGDLLQKLFADGGRMLTVPERVGLLSDVNALVRSGDLPAGDALALMPRVLADGNRHLYTATVRIVSSVKDDLVPEAQRATFARFVRDLYGKRARELGFTPSPGESADVELLRPQLLSLVTLEGEDSQLVAEARAQANRWLEDRAAVAPELVQLVLRVAARHGDAALLRRMQEATLASKSREERQRLLTALAAFRGPEAMAANMRLITSGGLDIREALSFLRAAIEDEGPQTRELTYQWLKASYEPLTAKLPREVLPHLAVVAGGFCDAGHRADAEAFFKERSAKLPGGERVLAQVLETIDLCTVFKEKQAPSVGAFLQTYGRPASSPRAPAPR
jgi:alanyl aminopeptidase